MTGVTPQHVLHVLFLRGVHVELELHRRLLGDGAGLAFLRNLDGFQLLAIALHKGLSLRLGHLAQ